MRLFKREKTARRARQGIAFGLAVLCTGSVLALSPVPAQADTLPGAPTDTRAIAGNASASVRWSAPADDSGSAITSYIVTTQGPGPLPSPIQKFGRSAIVRGLTNGVAYTFVVSAQNATGSGPVSVASASVVPVTVPAAPTSVAAFPHDGSITVSWSPPDHDGGSSVTAYTVTARLQAVVVQRVILPGSAGSVDVDGLTNGSGYTFTVTAANRSGSGRASRTVGPVAPGPEAPVRRAPSRSGYWMLEVDGQVHPFGDARSLGDPRGQVDKALAVDLEATPSGNGYWVVDDGGRVYAYGDAVRRGNLSGLAVGERVTSLSATPSGHGYWIFTNRGRAAPFGDATFLGDMSSLALNAPVSDSIASPSGDGYYLVAADGGIFAFGDAAFHGSTGGTRLNAPVMSLVPDADGSGYWLVAADGGIFAFDAPFRGSMGAIALNKPVTGMVRFGGGYLLVGTDGGVFNFSDHPFLGSLGATPPARPITAAAPLEG